MTTAGLLSLEHKYTMLWVACWKDRSCQIILEFAGRLRSTFILCKCFLQTWPRLKHKITVVRVWKAETLAIAHERFRFAQQHSGPHLDLKKDRRQLRVQRRADGTFNFRRHLQWNLTWPAYRICPCKPSEAAFDCSEFQALISRPLRPHFIPARTDQIRRDRIEREEQSGGVRVTTRCWWELSLLSFISRCWYGGFAVNLPRHIHTHTHRH